MLKKLKHFNDFQLAREEPTLVSRVSGGWSYWGWISWMWGTSSGTGPPIEDIDIVGSRKMGQGGVFATLSQEERDQLADALKCLEEHKATGGREDFIGK